jgi:uncharacterized protein (DUF2147 family)
MRSIWVVGLLLVLPVFSPTRLTVAATSDKSVIGRWKNQDATFEIYDAGGKLSAKIVSLREPKSPEGKDKTDIHNPDPSKRDRPVIGLVFMSGFVPAGPGKWDHGTIYDPKSGNTYSCNMELDNSDQLKVRGYVAISLIGRTDVWTRVN